jgi:hypothetical protein
MMIRSFNIKSFLRGIGLTIYFIIILNGRAYGYVMPAEQLLAFMADNFAGIQTAIIVQSTLKTEQDNEKVFMEQVQLKSPNLFSIKVFDNTAHGGRLPDMAYRQLLIANTSSRLQGVLSMMGINLQAVSFTRIDGIIAYRIGGKEDNSPRLLIEKERFLPLLLTYGPGGDMSGDRVTVRFKDYRREDAGWLPFQITYSVNDKIREEYTIQSLQTNVPLNQSLLQPFEIISYFPDQRMEETLSGSNIE